jgi:hypothetical protein
MSADRINPPAVPPAGARSPGLRQWCQRVVRWYLFVASTLLGTSLLLALLDPWVGAFTEPFSGDLKSIPYDTSQPWTEQFVRDQDQIGSSRTRYVPFTVWRRPVFQPSRRVLRGCCPIRCAA